MHEEWGCRLPPPDKIADAFWALLGARELIRGAAKAVEESCESSGFTRFINDASMDMDTAILDAVLATNGWLHENDVPRAVLKKHLPCAVVVDGKLLAAFVVDEDFYHFHDFGDESDHRVMGLAEIDLPNVLSTQGGWG